MRAIILGAIGWAVCLTGIPVQADSELDPKPKSVVISRLDKQNRTVTDYELKAFPAELANAALAPLSKEQQKARIEGALAKVLATAKVLKTETVSPPASELDGDRATGAWGWRWGRWNYAYSNYGYYGYPYYGSVYGGYYDSYYYQPYWGYNSYYGYYNTWYTGYYPYSYYSYSPYYTYTLYYGW